MRRVVIVGGGFSGAAAAIHLSRSAEAPLEILVVEPRDALGAGIAHSSTEPDHRLNAPDNFHSPYPEDEAHFARWLRESGALAADPEAMAASGLVFARRRAFGRYMDGEADRHARGNASASRIEHVRKAALRMGYGQSAIEVELDDGSRLGADACILALGWNPVGTPRELLPIGGHPGWVGDPWATRRLDAIGSEAPVLLVGSGLTASDAFAALTARGHRGPVLSLSRHGLRPGSQNPHRSSRPIFDRITERDPEILRRAGTPTNVRAAVRLLRGEIAAVDPAASSWHTPFDALRDASWLFWGRWPEAERRRFARHVKAWYDAFRFRNPPQVEKIVDEGLRSGRLSFAQGRLRDARVDGELAVVEYDSRWHGARRVVRTGAVINCTGPRLRPSHSGNPFWQALVGDGVARDDPCGLGVDVDPRGRVVAANGRPHEAIFAIGPPTMGRFGEAAAVPYVVRGILEVTRQIVGQSRERGGCGVAQEKAPTVHGRGFQ